ncbi:hypothetical protein Pla175_14710 [Pirellulimonas nuda]|uniref:TraB family protein n=1 Tax=Pirellulimonas nuda TaxID=2528009 RepID=A0A518D9E8_9BACT|nr:hypothetical protein [Pirellulimonas nuda]QDU88100.1 hypothetical protein Pla175_14710 [Pirellulimonas nuda]
MRLLLRLIASPRVQVLAWAAALAAAQALAKEAPDAQPAGQAGKPPAAEQLPGDSWVRLATDPKGRPLGLQTAIVRYQNADASVEVDLIGAIHVGDLAYYRALNRRFGQYDALLYELVAPEGTVVQPGRGTSNGSAVGALQNGMKGILELEHQLERVDYTKPNFVHADMSPDDFQKSMTDRGEGFLQLYFKMLGSGIAAQSKMAVEGKSADADILMALFSQNRANKLKIAMAKQLCEMGSMLSALGGEQGSTLITERNRIALQVMKREIAEGKTRLGVFYGAGHLEDMDQRLREEHKLRPVSVEWLTAWDLTK